MGARALFTIVAAFTFATYRLAGEPLGLPTIVLGDVFMAYLLGLLATPLDGVLID